MTKNLNHKPYIRNDFDQTCTVSMYSFFAQIIKYNHIIAVINVKVKVFKTVEKVFSICFMGVQCKCSIEIVCFHIQPFLKYWFLVLNISCHPNILRL